MGLSIKRLLLNGGVLVCAAASVDFMVSQINADSAQNSISVAGKSSTSNLQTAYQQWSDSYSKTNPTGPVVSLQYNRGLSAQFTEAKGIAQFDFERNKVSVRMQSVRDPEVSHVWLINNVEGDGHSVMPESGDNFLYAGQLNIEEDGNAWLDAEIDQLSSFPLDMVVISRSGETPENNSVALGTVSLFQEMFHYPEREKSWARNDSTFSFLGIQTAQATAGLTPPGFFENLDSDLVNIGRDIFFNETFDGNGRTCGTCHKEEDNLALGLDTIAKLPNNDPLFIVEQEYRLDGTPNALFNEFRFEKPALMRKVGLIVENLNGFREADGSFTERINMRSPQHVLSMTTSLAPPPAEANNDGTLPVSTNDLIFAERTGWSGDGTPTGFREDFFQSNGRELDGSLRDFAVGAVIQHFPLTMDRSALSVDDNGQARQPDFRFPTEFELDAMEAFMLSTGDQAPKDNLEFIGLVDEIADRGRLNFMGFNVFDPSPNDGRPPLNCNSCHFNGSAMTNPTFPFPSAVTPNHDLDDLAAAGGFIVSHNRSFSPQAERLADQAPDIIVQTVDDPSVAGDCFNLGLAEVPLLPNDQPGVISAGCDANPFDNGFAFGLDDENADQRIVADRFNAPAVFEAMDNPPFFHGHQIDTIEGAVAFYAANRHMRNGDFLPAIVPLNAPQIINVARFMRVMGSDFNATSAITLLDKAQGFSRFHISARRTNVRLAAFEVEDAIQLLQPVHLHITDAQPKLEQALRILRSPVGFTTRNINRARALLQEAQNDMVVRG
ncbi:MAG: hypothetical protein MI750_12685 [Xanthomonadales bacterium]|nr:hypothetical protein [Xanthomonadales bacterium]